MKRQTAVSHITTNIKILHMSVVIVLLCVFLTIQCVLNGSLVCGNSFNNSLITHLLM